jgi:hypothetical protein
VSGKEQLHERVNQLPAEEIEAARRYLEFPMVREEPAVDPHMLSRIDSARANRSGGIPHEEILKEFGA